MPKISEPPSAKLPKISAEVKTSHSILEKDLPLSGVPLTPAIPALPAAYSEPAWYVAPKQPLSLWKIAAIVVLVAGALFGASAFFFRDRSRPAPQASTQNPSIVASAPSVTTTSRAAVDSSLDKTPLAPTTSPVIKDPPRTSPEFRDEPASPDSDEQFTDQPRARTSQVTPATRPPARENSSSRTDTRTDVRPATGNPKLPIDQLSPPATSPRTPPDNSTATASRANDSPASRTQNNSQTNSSPTAASPRPVTNPLPPAATQSATRNQEPNSAPASGQASSLPQVMPPANRTANTTSPAPSSSSPGASSTTPATSPTAISPAVQPLTGSVSFYSRFRSIRASTDSLRPAGAVLQIGPLLTSPVPAYPSEAQRQQIQGLVELQVLVGSDGNVQSVHLVKGPAELASAAMGAVRAWHYGPTTLGGHAVETDQSIFFTFKLSR